MTQALLEILGMLLVALGIGVFFTYRYWKSKFDSVQQANESLQASNDELSQKASAHSKEIENQKSAHQQEMAAQEESQKGALDDLNKALKKLKSEEKASSKALKEEKKNTKEAASKVKSLEEALEIKDEQLGEKERELAEVSEHFKTHNISYYKQIDGKRYKSATLLEADEAVAGIGDGRISKADAEKIFATISDGHTYTQVEKDTMHYIREHYKWTPESDELFRKKVRTWAAKGHQLSE